MELFSLYPSLFLYLNFRPTKCPKRKNQNVFLYVSCFIFCFPQYCSQCYFPSLFHFPASVEFLSVAPVSCFPVYPNPLSLLCQIVFRSQYHTVLVLHLVSLLCVRQVCSSFLVFLPPPCLFGYWICLPFRGWPLTSCWIKDFAFRTLYLRLTSTFWSWFHTHQPLEALLLSFVFCFSFYKVGLVTELYPTWA